MIKNTHRHNCSSEYSMASHSNEIHDIDVATAQDGFHLPSVPRRRRPFRDTFPPFLARKVYLLIHCCFGGDIYVSAGVRHLRQRRTQQAQPVAGVAAGGVGRRRPDRDGDDLRRRAYLGGAHEPRRHLGLRRRPALPMGSGEFLITRFDRATVGSFILRGLLHPITDLGTTTPSGAAGKALVAEIIVTFNMMFVTLAVATDTRAVGELAGLAVGSAVCITSIFAGPISGGSMNPARTLGPAFASNIYSSVWVYLVGPPIGTIAGALAYNFIRLQGPTLSQSSQKGSQKSPSIKMRRMQRQEEEEEEEPHVDDDGDASC
ncbi:hypothetical protein ZIOFF_074121 [Zingiber officinale]|uniref:Uncharacterized protein n=1 Tax=Zingiber officinale TaxID=94328 RepID=A0A8J5BD10_ZINOF|nr:hypothetical protein ZIOFF_074121 [Zingiber officinale]